MTTSYVMQATAAPELPLGTRVWRACLRVPLIGWVARIGCAVICAICAMTLCSPQAHADHELTADKRVLHFSVAKEASQYLSDRDRTEIAAIMRQEHLLLFSEEQLAQPDILAVLMQADAHAALLSQVAFQALIHFAADDLVGVGFELDYDMSELTSANPPQNRNQRKQLPPDGTWHIRHIRPSAQQHHVMTGASSSVISDGLEVTHINGVTLSTFDDKDILLVNHLLLGKKDTPVTLAVVSADGVLSDITVRRHQGIDSEMSLRVVDDVAIITVPSFVMNSSHQLLDMLSSYPNLRGVLFDVRNNPGGVLDGAIEIANLFSVNTPLVKLIGRQRAVDIYTIKSRADLLHHGTDVSPSLFNQLQHMPLAVLINHDTASAAEVFASGLQEAGRAVVYGETSRGKGSVQQVLPLRDGRALKFTVAHYVTPKNSSIDGVGVVPDYPVLPTALPDQAALDSFVRQVFPAYY